MYHMFTLLYNVQDKNPGWDIRQTCQSLKCISCRVSRRVAKCDIFRGLFVTCQNSERQSDRINVRTPGKPYRMEQWIRSNKVLAQPWVNAGPASMTLAKHQINTDHQLSGCKTQASCHARDPVITCDEKANITGRHLLQFSIKTTSVLRLRSANVGIASL